MPITGQDALLSSLIVSELSGKLEEVGYSDFDKKSLKALGDGLAAAIITFLTANLQVNPGQPVATSGGGGASSGPGTVS